MVYQTLTDASRMIASCMAAQQSLITVQVLPKIIEEGSILQRVCEADPRLLLCIKNMQIRIKKLEKWMNLSIKVDYTGTLPSTVIKIEEKKDLQEAAYQSATLHRRDFPIVYPTHMHDIILKETKLMLESHRFLNCFVTGFRSETKKISECGYMALDIHFKYSCTYKEWMNRNKLVNDEIASITRKAGIYGTEDWKKAYFAVKYCVENWNYGSTASMPGIEYTAYGAIINKTAVCMGISLAVCAIFEKMGIPCRYVRGVRNGEGHAWNLVYIKQGWFYIDVTDAIIMRNPLYHWGMTRFDDRTISKEIAENLSCNCSPAYIRNMGFV